jgi:FkbM family methyltransferase
MTRSAAAQPVRADSGYYPVVASCQIPNLSFLFELMFGRRDSGVFVEVGGYDGLTFSNTWGLTERGWAGLLIEPVPDLARLCRENHRNHPLVRTLEVAVGRREDVEARLFLAGSLTTANRDQMLEYEGVVWARPSLTPETLIVPSRPLDSILIDEGFAPGFDLLVVDVEGREQAVFSAFDLDEWRPKMLIVELGDIHPDLTTSRTSDYRLGRSLTASGYDVIYKDSINTVLARRDIAEAAYGRQLA